MSYYTSVEGNDRNPENSKQCIDKSRMTTLVYKRSSSVHCCLTLHTMNDMEVPALEYPQPQRTNTLIITGLPLQFFHPVVLNTLKACFAVYGTIHSWVPLKNFCRAIVVYHSEDDAEYAKLDYDGYIIPASGDWFVVSSPLSDSKLTLFPAQKQGYEYGEQILHH